ncbi:hypothetical protein [Streptomyces tibetensis]|uniref:hypothetical protein n=1 Tax=Streptomyces tibetensis TaxID=2382123 RepID=UPI0033E37E39
MGTVPAGAYTWPDGLKVTVVDAKVFTDFDKDLLESPEPGSTDFRVTSKLQNTGKFNGQITG